jgi:hypothetical protein
MTQEERQEWEAKKLDWATRVKQIVIPVDISAGMVKKLNADIDNLYTDIRLEYAALRADKEAIDKRIYVIEKKASALGRNDQDRKANGVSAVEAFETQEGETVNLWQIYDDIVEQYEFVSSVIDILDTKHNRLVLTSGILKLERGIL